MNTAEFTPIAAAIQKRWWAFPIPAAALDQFVKDLGHLPAADVAAAVASLSSDGLPRVPTPGQVHRRALELQLRAPSWPEARAALVAWRRRSERRVAAVEAWVCTAGLCDGSGFETTDNDARDCACRPARAERLRGLGELPVLVAEFVSEQHVSVAEVDKLIEGDTALDAQVRGRWEALARKIIEARVLAALPVSAGYELPAVQAARVGAAARDRDGSLRRMDPVALLGRGE